MFLDTQTDDAVKKHAAHLLADLDVASINDLNFVGMKASERNLARDKIATTARNLIGKITDKTPDDRAKSIEMCFDGLLGIVQEIDTGTRDNQKSDSRKPIGADAIQRGIDDGMDDEPIDQLFGLRSDQRFTTWAQAKSPGDKYRGLSLGGYLRSMVVGAKTDVERRALAEGSDSSGGYTTPTPLSAQLIDLMRAQSVVIKAGAQTVPLTSDKNNIAKLLTDPVPAWRLEAGAVAESDPTFGNIQMVPRSLAVMTKISYELMEDSLNLQTELPRILAAAMAVELDRVALLGSGSAPEPLGIAGTSGIGTTAHGAALTAYAPFVTMRTGILSANAGPVSAIIMHPRDEGTLSGLLDTTGQPLNAPKAISDIPTLTTTSIPIDGGAGTDESTIFAGNFSHLMVGIRSDVRVEVVRELYAANLQYAIIAHMRADIAVQHASAFHTLTGVQG